MSLVMDLWKRDRDDERRLGPFVCPGAYRALYERLNLFYGPYEARRFVREWAAKPQAARDVAPGESWAFRDHKSQAEFAA
jgi:hypothetical protein